MNCEQCGDELEPYDEMVTIDRLVGSWEGNTFYVSDQKDTGVCDILSRTLFCCNGHESPLVDFSVEW